MRDISTLRYSCSHVLAQAVKKIWSEVKLGIGPAIENGFYYVVTMLKYYRDTCPAKL